MTLAQTQARLGPGPKPHDAGMAAYRRGSSEADNPHDREGFDRQQWHVGFVWARMLAREKEATR